MEFNKERFLKLETRGEISEMVIDLCQDWSGNEEIPFIDIVDVLKDFNDFELTYVDSEPIPIDVLDEFFYDNFFIAKESLSMIEDMNLRLVIKNQDLNYKTEEYAEFIRQYNEIFPNQQIENFEVEDFDVYLNLKDGGLRAYNKFCDSQKKEFMLFVNLYTKINLLKNKSKTETDGILFIIGLHTLNKEYLERLSKLYPNITFKAIYNFNLSKVKKLYISGQVSGLDLEDVKKRFEDKKKYLQENYDFEVVNPLENGLSVDLPWIKHICHDLEQLHECDSILMLDGWRNSKGACLEKEFATLTKKTIIYENEL